MKNKIIKVLICTVIIIVIIVTSIYKYNKIRYQYIMNYDHISLKVDKEGTLYISGDYKKNKSGFMSFPDQTHEIDEHISPITKRVVVDLKNIDNTYHVGADLTEATNFDFSKTDMTNLDDVSNTFTRCNSLVNIDLSDWDVSKVTTARGMFSGCQSLAEIKGLDKLSFDSCRNYESMFGGCENLKKIKLNGKLNETSGGMYGGFYCIFYECESLEVIDLSDFDFSNIYTYELGDEVPELFDAAFYGCNSLKKIIANDTFKIVEENYVGELPEIEYVNN